MLLPKRVKYRRQHGCVKQLVVLKGGNFTTQRLVSLVTSYNNVWITLVMGYCSYSNDTLHETWRESLWIKIFHIHHILKNL